MQNGIFNCPLELQIIPFLCDLFEADPYNFLFNGSIPLSFSDYFTMYWNKTEYLNGNECLPLLNNQKQHANSSAYTAAIASIQNIVLSEALQDTVVYPFQSEQFGGYAFQGAKANPVTLNFTQGDSYSGDLIGLRTRALQNPTSLVLSSFEGDHIRFSDAYWNSVIIPYLQ